MVQAMAIKSGAHRLSGWIPIRIFWQASEPRLEWMYLGASQLSEPFFDQSVEKLVQQPFNMLFRHQTTMEELAELHSVSPGVTPSGFIFHMSRCGSSLVSQLLASSAQNIVISEAEPIRWVLQERDHNISCELRSLWLKWIISALGQPKTGRERLFIKFDSLSILFLDLVRSTFPHVPWVFIYRDPIEVIISHLRRRGVHTIPGRLGFSLLGLQPTALSQLPTEEYCAQVLAKISQAALQQHLKEPTSLLVNYKQLPEVAWKEIFSQFSLSISARERTQLRNLAQRDAKNPSIRFVDDSAAKRSEASDKVLRLVKEWLSPTYNELEACRLRRLQIC